MPKTNPKGATEKEGRLLLAEDAFLKGKFPSIRAAANMYRVSPETLRCRINGRQPRQEAPPDGRVWGHCA